VVLREVQEDSQQPLGEGRHLVGVASGQLLEVQASDDDGAADVDVGTA
jgi:hypothetical protein